MAPGNVSQCFARLANDSPLARERPAKPGQHVKRVRLVGKDRGEARLKFYQERANDFVSKRWFNSMHWGRHAATSRQADGCGTLPLLLGTLAMAGCSQPWGAAGPPPRYSITGVANVANDTVQVDAHDRTCNLVTRACTCLCHPMIQALAGRGTRRARGDRGAPVPPARPQQRRRAACGARFNPCAARRAT